MSEQKVIVPTVGRKVWLELNGATSIARYASGGFINGLTGQPIDATITAVWTDSMINIAGFDAQGYPYLINSIVLVQPDAPAPYSGQPYVRWMPYQVKTAEDGK